MPNRQIGTSSSIEELLLSDISKQLDRLIQVAAGGGGGGSGTVTSVSVTSANGFAGSVATATTTPAITISTTVTGIIKGNGTAISAAVAGTDYLAPNGSGVGLSGIALLASVNTFTANNILQPTVTTGTGATAGVQIAANALTSGEGLSVSSSSVTSGFIAKIISTTTAINHTVGTNALFGIVSTGANANSARTTVGQHVSVTNTGTTSVNIAAYFEASGAASTNIAIRTGAGQVAFGTASPQPSSTCTINTNGLTNSLSLHSAGSQVWAMSSQNITHTANQSTFAGTAYALNLSGANNSTGVINGVLFAGSMTQGASWTGDVAHFRINSIYNTNASANGTFYGFDYNPTVTQIGTSRHYAIRTTSGQVVFGHTSATTSTTRLQVRGIGTTTGALVLFEDSAGTNRFTLSDNGNITGTRINVEATSNYHTSLGGETDFTGAQSVTIGWRASAKTSNVVAIGSSALYSVAGTVGTQAIAIGKEANANVATAGQDSIAIGYQTVALLDNSIVIGAVATAKGTQNTAIGYRAGNTSGTHGDNATSLGYHANFGTANIGAYSITLGQGNSTVQGAFTMAYRTGGGISTNAQTDSFALAWDSATPDILLAKSADMFINNTTGGLVIGGTTLANSSVILELQSTTKAFIPTKMTSTQRDALTAVAGMVIYNTTTNKLNVYTTAWEAVTSV